jgi:hypothetical protein
MNAEMPKAYGIALRRAGVADAATIAGHRYAMFRDMGYNDEAALDSMRKKFLPWVEAKLNQATTWDGWAGGPPYRLAGCPILARLFWRVRVGLIRRAEGAQCLSTSAERTPNVCPEILFIRNRIPARRRFISVHGDSNSTGDTHPVA